MNTEAGDKLSLDQTWGIVIDDLSHGNGAEKLARRLEERGGPRARKFAPLLMGAFGYRQKTGGPRKPDIWIEE